MLAFGSIKVFKMNDYEWMAGESKEQVKKAYIEQVGLSDEDAKEELSEICEVDIDKEGRWAEIRSLEELKDAAKNRKGNELVVKWWQGVFSYWQTFREALAQDLAAGQEVPYVIASTEV